MSPPSRSEAPQVLTQELREIAAPSLAFDRDLAARIGKCIAVRRTFCGFSKQQLGARLGIGLMELEAYEQGEKRMSCGLLLETAKQLKAAPRFFFNDLAMSRIGLTGRFGRRIATRQKRLESQAFGTSST